MADLLNIEFIIFVEFAKPIQFNIFFYLYHPNLNIKSSPNFDFNYGVISIVCYWMFLAFKILIIFNNWLIIWYSIGMLNLILLSELSLLIHLNFLLQTLLPPNRFLLCTCHILNPINFRIIFAFSMSIFSIKDLILHHRHIKIFKI